MVALLTNPDQLDAVRRDRLLVPAAIEEALRWEPPVCQALRTPVEAIEIAGHAIAPGDLIAFSLSAINRDPGQFEDPDRYDVYRCTKNHAAFSMGAQMYLGQHLARIEMATVLNLLLDRLPRLRLDADYPEPTISGFMLRGPETIRVRFD